MYKRGTASRGSTAKAFAFGAVLVVFLFSLIPLLNRFDRMRSSGPASRSVLATVPSQAEETSMFQSSAARAARMVLTSRDQSPSGWLPVARPVIEKPANVEMPVLEGFNLAKRIESEFVFNVDDLDFMPSPYHRQVPVYPVALRREAIEGEVVAEFRVDREGKTNGIKIISSDHPEFSAAVVGALLQWRFMPGRIDGEPVEFRMRIPMVFRLRDDLPSETELYLASLH